MIIGNAGGGKSTLGHVLSAAHNLPNHAIDKILWNPGWVRRPEAAYLADHAAWLLHDRWLIDGFGSWPSVQARIKAADTIIFIDLPILLHYWWATKRQVKSLFVTLNDTPDGCTMFPATLRLYRMMWWLHRDMRPKLIAAINAEAVRATIIHVRSRKSLAALAASLV